MNKAGTSRPCGVHVFQERGFEGDEELRSVLLESPGALEPGLEIIDTAVGPSTRFDVVAIDRVGQLVLVEGPTAGGAGASLLRPLRKRSLVAAYSRCLRIGRELERLCRRRRKCERQMAKEGGWA